MRIKRWSDGSLKTVTLRLDPDQSKKEKLSVAQANALREIAVKDLFFEMLPLHQRNTVRGLWNRGFVAYTKWNGMRQIHLTRKGREILEALEKRFPDFM